MYTDKLIRTMLRENVVLFKTTLANNYYSFSVARFRENRALSVISYSLDSFQNQGHFLAICPR